MNKFLSLKLFTCLLFLGILTINKSSALAQSTDYLIITATKYQDELQPLVEWKRQKGYYVDVVAYEEIASSSGQLKTWINNYHKRHKFKYLLIGGSHWDVPGATFVNSKGGAHITDYPYACINVAHVPDIVVGRFSAHTEQDMVNMVNKTIRYDKTPDEGDWYKHIVGISDAPVSVVQDKKIGQFLDTNLKLTNFLSGEFDNIGYPESKNKPGYTAKHFIEVYKANGELSDARWDGFDWYNEPYKLQNNKLLPDELRSSLYTRDDRENANEPYFKAMNQSGAGILYINGHGSAHKIGFISPYFTFEQRMLNNGAKTPLAFFAGCSSGKMNTLDSYNVNPKKSFVENWLTHEGGAVGVIAATRPGLGYNDDNLLTYLFDGIWNDLVPGYDKDGYSHNYRPAEALNYAKGWFGHDPSWHDEDVKNQHNNTFIYYGDPELMLRTDSPKTFTVNLATNGNVHVTVNEKALISLYDGKKIYRKEATEATFNVPNGDYTLTITAHNYTAYTKAITLTDAPAEKIAGYEKVLDLNAETNKAGDMQFGNRLASANGYLAIAASNYSGEKVRMGAVYIYKDDKQVQRFVNEAPVLNQRFGDALAMDGDYLMVGAPGSDQAEVFIYKKGETFALEQKLVGPNSDKDFGETLAIKGNYAIVGASDQSKVYIYKKGTTWNLVKTLSGTGAFGKELAYDGQRLIVSDDSWNNNAGLVKIYKQNGNEFTEEATINAENSNEVLGQTLAINGDYAVMGCSINTSENVKIYKFDGIWKYVETLLPMYPNSIHDFSSSLYFDGDVLLVGANGYGDYTGTFYAYQREGDSFERVYYDRESYSSYERVGTAITLCGSNVYVGAPDRIGNSNFGTVYKYRLKCPTPDYTVMDNENGTARITINTDYSIVQGYEWTAGADGGTINTGDNITLPRGETVYLRLKAVCGDEYKSTSEMQNVTLKAEEFKLAIKATSVKEREARFEIEADYSEYYYGAALRGTKKPTKQQLIEGKNGDGGQLIWPRHITNKSIAVLSIGPATEYDLFVCTKDERFSNVVVKPFNTVDLTGPRFNYGTPYVSSNLIEDNRARLSVQIYENCLMYYMVVTGDKVPTSEEIKNSNTMMYNGKRGNRLVTKHVWLNNLSSGTDYKVYCLAVDDHRNETRAMVSFKTKGVSTGIEVKETRANIYPNPAIDIVYFPKSKQIDLYSLTGKKVLSKKQSNVLDVSELEAGLYILKLLRDNSWQAVKIKIQ